MKRQTIIGSMLLNVANWVLKVILLICIGRSIDSINTRHGNIWVGVSVVLVAAGFVFSYLARLMKHKMENELCLIERKKFFDSLYSADWQIRSKQSNGSLTYISTSQIPEFAHEIVEIYAVGMKIAATVGAVICSVAALHYSYYFIYFILIPLCVYISLKAADICLATHEKRHLANSVHMSNLEESLFHAFEIRLLGQSTYFQKRYEESNQRAIESETAHQRSILKYRSVETLCTCTVTVFLLVHSIFLIKHSILTIGMLVPVLGYGTELFNCLSELNYIKDMLLDISTILRSISIFPAARPQGKRCTAVNTHHQEAISTKGLSFSYLDSKKVIRFNDIRIQRGEHIVIAGKSGTGKTTFFRILLRFCSNYDGTIHLFGVPLCHYPQNELLSKYIAYMPAEQFLFSDTIINNITFGNKKLAEQVKTVLHELGLNSILYDSDGTEKVISNGGENLSGGERQRILLLRCLCEEKEIYLLDEPTSQLDAVSEDKVIALIKRMCSEKTVILISHNDHMLNSFDRKVDIVHAGPCD